MATLRERFQKSNKELMKKYPNADERVLGFITDFCTKVAVTEYEYEILRSTFRNGYCWHFAHLLKTTFGRGDVCIAAPFGHFVWIDNKIPYDIEGIYNGEAVHFILERYLGKALDDFKHIPCMGYEITAEEILDIVHRYEDDNSLPHDDERILKYL